MKKRMMAFLLALTMVLSAAGCKAPAADETTLSQTTAENAIVTTEAEETTEEEANLDVTTDIVIIGGGLAGLTASLSASDAGKEVILVERMGYVGGNCLLSTGILQAAGSQLQAAAQIEDSAEIYWNDMSTGDAAPRDPVQMKMVADYSGTTIDWLVEKGVVFSETVPQATGSTAYRAHLAMPDASGLVTPLQADAEAAGVDIRMNTLATGYIMEGSAVKGITVTGENGETYHIYADKVILACGGFGASAEMLEKYWGAEYAAMTYAGVVGTKGEMLEEAFNIGAAKLDMDKANYGSPTVDVTKNMLITAMVMTYGAILVDNTAQRFCNETASAFDVAVIVTNQTAATNSDCVYEIFDSQEVGLVPKIQTYIDMGITTQADTIEELAALVGLDADALQATMDEYNACVGGAEDEFGRSIYQNPIEEGPFYCIKVNSGGVMTFGGVAINETCQVLDESGAPIEGLYAAGECVGGYRAYGYVCGDSNIHSAVTGMLAGKYAAE